MFAFYDFETTGTSPAFDQPIQFAAILTDDDFNQVERVNIRCRLSPHILPAPWAMAVTGVTPEELEDPGLPTWFEFSHQISALIKRWAPATWAGYNSIAFDEEFLRQSFYQNLHPNIYQTQFNHNDRLDLMKVIYAVWDRAPDALEWPLDDRGRLSFKLDRLAPASGFTAHNAHDALGDVEAAIHVATLIRDRAPAVWARCLRNRDKHAVADTLQSGHPVQLIERFGAAPPRPCVGVYAGTNSQNKNAMGFLDLNVANTSEIVDADDEALRNAVSGIPNRHSPKDCSSWSDLASYLPVRDGFGPFRPSSQPRNFRSVKRRPHCIYVQRGEQIGDAARLYDAVKAYDDAVRKRHSQLDSVKSIETGADRAHKQALPRCFSAVDRYKPGQRHRFEDLVTIKVLSFDFTQGAKPIIRRICSAERA